MNEPLRYGSVCSGIEAATVAWHPLGWTPAWFSEIEPFPCDLLAHHYPDTTNLGDMTKITEDQLERHGTINLLVGGTPCQSFSVAGLRKGLDDPRGNLSLEFLRLADRARPQWLVWENVPGVLSSDEGRAFGSILGAMAELGYGWAYRVLDAQYIRVDGYERAVPQRRRRVFVVGCLGDWRSAAAVFFERACLSGHPAPRREAGQGTAAHAIRGTAIGRKPENGPYRDYETELMFTLGASNHERHAVSALTNHGVGASGADDNQAQAGHLVAMSGDVSYALNAGGMGRSDLETKTMIPVSFHSRQDPITNGDCSLPLEMKGGQAVAQPIPIDMRQASRGERMTNNRAAGKSSGGAPGTGIGESGDPSPTLADSHTPAVAFAQNTRDEVRMCNGDGQITAALAAESGMKQQTYLAIRPNMAVRRLTPLECERLQGFPDGYTLIPRANGKMAADGPRYRALGNSMAVNAMRWIGRRIEMLHKLESTHA